MIDFNHFVHAWQEPQDKVPSELRWIETHPAGCVRLISGKKAFDYGKADRELTADW